MSFRIEDRGNGIMWARVSNEYYGIRELSSWCKETGCGKQVNTSAISFKNESELTMFLLRWQNQES